jgi:hypothetical protein
MIFSVITCCSADGIDLIDTVIFLPGTPKQASSSVRIWCGAADKVNRV